MNLIFFKNKNPPSVKTDRGRISAVPPLVRQRMLTFENAVTGAPDKTYFIFFGIMALECIRLCSARFLTPTESSLCRMKQGYFFPS